MIRVPMERLVRFGVDFLSKRGVPEKNAGYLSEIIVTTEAFRQSTHGLVQFKALAGVLGTSVDPTAEPTVVRETTAGALVDGNRSVGNLAMKLAKELAVARAREHGVGFVAVRNSQWIGAVGMHLISVAEEGLLAWAYAHTNNCKDCAPVGGYDARFSTNPLAVAFPGTTYPVLADFSTATMSMGAAGDMIAKQEKASTARFIDNQGHPTTDPAVMETGGTLMFMGGDVDGHKGYALSLFVEALVVMSGASANNPEEEPRQSFGLLVLDPAAFGGTEFYEREMARFIDHVKSSRTRPGVREIRLPGERGFAALADCRVNGVPLDNGKLDMLNGIADENGIARIG